MNLVWSVGAVTFFTGLTIGGVVVSSIRAVWEKEKLEAQHRFFMATQTRIIDAIGMDGDDIDVVVDDIKYAELHTDCEYLVDEEGLFHHHCCIPDE